MSRVLIIDDEENILKTLSGILSGEGHVPITAARGYDGIALASEYEIACILLDVWLPDIDGLEVLRELKRANPVRPVIMMSGHSTISTAVDATKLGAYSFLEKPLDLDRLLLELRNALKLSELEFENILLREKSGDDPVLIGNSARLSELRNFIAQVAPTNSRILITGENGTGKEIVARMIYSMSQRKSKPFIKVNCAAIPTELIESELFGHVKGAFTGATEAKPGKFELASEGTIFLDEVGDMSLNAQAKVLRVLEENEIERVGGKKPIKVDVRVIAATNQNLEELIKDGRFREDLYFRLNVIPINVPPLREHPDDIPSIAQHFLSKYASENNRRPKTLTKDAIGILRGYHWPGNVRELRNSMERLAILAPGDSITVSDLAGIIPGVNRSIDYVAQHNILEPERSQTGLDEIHSMKQAVADFEKALILKMLDQNDGNVKKTAELLKIERSHLYKKMKALGIDPSDRT